MDDRVQTFASIAFDFLPGGDPFVANQAGPDDAVGRLCEECDRWHGVLVRPRLRRVRALWIRTINPHAHGTARPLTTRLGPSLCM
jgi:hypothetical protein